MRHRSLIYYLFSMFLWGSLAELYYIWLTPWCQEAIFDEIFNIKMSKQIIEMVLLNKKSRVGYKILFTGQITILLQFPNNSLSAIWRRCLGGKWYPLQLVIVFWANRPCCCFRSSGSQFFRWINDCAWPVWNDTAIPKMILCESSLMSPEGKEWIFVSPWFTCLLTSSIMAK